MLRALQLKVRRVGRQMDPLRDCTLWHKCVRAHSQTLSTSASAPRLAATGQPEPGCCARWARDTCRGRAWPRRLPPAARKSAAGFPKGCGLPSPGRALAAERMRARGRVGVWAWPWPWPWRRGTRGAATAERGGRRACERERERAPGRAAPAACCRTAAGGTRSRSAPADPTTSPRPSGPVPRRAARPELGAGPAKSPGKPWTLAARPGPKGGAEGAVRRRKGRIRPSSGRLSTYSGAGLPAGGPADPGFPRVLVLEEEFRLTRGHISRPHQLWAGATILGRRWRASRVAGRPATGSRSVRGLGREARAGPRRPGLLSAAHLTQ